MIKEQRRLFIRIQRFVDLCLVTVAFFLGYLLRDKINFIYPFNLLERFLWDETLRSISYYAIYIGLLPVLLLVWGSLLSYFGMYNATIVRKISDVITIVLKATFVGFILMGSYIFILRMQEDISRLFIGFTFLASALLISIEKILVIYSVKVLEKKDESFKSSLIAVGIPAICCRPNKSNVLALVLKFAILSVFYDC